MPYKTSKDVLNGFNSILAKITPKLKTMFNVTPKQSLRSDRQRNSEKQVPAQNIFRELRMEKDREFSMFRFLIQQIQCYFRNGISFLTRSYSGTSLSGFFAAGKYQAS
jgi:hypothetical protein